MVRARITGVGGYLPERLVTNEELSRTVDTSDEWIVARTGIRQRHLAGAHETAAFMATRAAQAALAQAGVDAGSVDAIILATATPDDAFPATAVRVQAALGITTGFAFDVSAACSGFVYALATADAFIRAGTIRTALVIGSEVYSRILDWTDRGTCVLFGDGAGAVLLQAGPDGADPAAAGILSTHLHANGAHAGLLYVDGAVGQPDRPGHLVMKGSEVFRHAVAKLAGAVDEALARQRPGAVRRGLAGPAPGQPPHHRQHGQEARPDAGARGGDGGPPRQHLGRLDPPGFGRSCRRWAHQARPPDTDGGAGRRADLGVCSGPDVTEG